ncbi:hypothetical protein Aph02nite_61370 [Actinoplanes philippinensis]|uniref:hypothetical protein n=1 Tax=Actinoplanes philippinensis TaxID=35752 RepID=UPI001A47105D|nr:hypothetical protein [Actinoplanes philippinensis]GIE80187.1 hypothetical protein Aph02nite_61370 [Actinoplanes philippinensis]
MTHRGGAGYGAAAAFAPLPPDDDVLLLVEELDELDDVVVEDVDDELDVSAFLGAASVAPEADFSALTLPERESLR